MGGVAIQVASWKVSRYKGVSQLHCVACRAPAGHLVLKASGGYKDNAIAGEKTSQNKLAEKKKRTRPPPKENILGNFSGSKKNFPGPMVDIKTL